jgi:predicted DNA-binding protein
MPHTEALRSAKVTTALTPEMAARLKAVARRRRWSLSVATAVAIEHGIEAIEGEDGRSLQPVAHGSAA